MIATVERKAHDVNDKQHGAPIGISYYSPTLISYLNKQKPIGMPSENKIHEITEYNTSIMTKALAMSISMRFCSHRCCWNTIHTTCVLNVSSTPHAIAGMQTAQHLPAHQVPDSPDSRNRSLPHMGHCIPRGADDLLVCSTTRLYEVLPSLWQPWLHYVDIQRCRISRNGRPLGQRLALPA